MGRTLSGKSGGGTCQKTHVHRYLNYYDLLRYFSPEAQNLTLGEEHNVYEII